MTQTEILTALARYAAESAVEAHHGDVMPRAQMAWEFTLEAEHELVDLFEEPTPWEMPETFALEYDRKVVLILTGMEVQA